MSRDSAFVAGATGYVGRAVVSRLRAKDIHTIAHVRPDSPRLAYWQRTFEDLGAVVDATSWREGAMAAALRTHRPQVVFALLGTTRARVRQVERDGGDPSLATYEAVDYGLSLELLEASLAAASSRFIYLSSAGVGPGARGAYLSVRYRLEARLIESGLPYLIARPGLITGPDRGEVRPLETIAGYAARGVAAMLGGFGASRLRRRLKPIDGERLAVALVHLAFTDGNEGRIVGADELNEPPESNCD